MARGRPGRQTPGGMGKQKVFRDNIRVSYIFFFFFTKDRVSINDGGEGTHSTAGCERGQKVADGASVWLSIEQFMEKKKIQTC